MVHIFVIVNLSGKDSDGYIKEDMQWIIYHKKLERNIMGHAQVSNSDTYFTNDSQKDK